MPSRRIFLDMCYKPRLTPLIEHAAVSKHCTAISGIEAMLEQGFAQARMWLAGSAERGVGLSSGSRVYEEGCRSSLLSSDVEEKVKEMIRSLPDILPKGST
jgi:quinate dehydrogenase